MWFSTTSKLLSIPSWGIPAEFCKTGMALRRRGIDKKVPTPCAVCYCYAGPIRFRRSWRRLAGNYREYLDDPKKWVNRMVWKISETGTRYFRFFHSGDLQGMAMLRDIAEVARRSPNVKFWLPTQEWGVVDNFLLIRGDSFPPNLTVRLSSPFIDKPCYNPRGYRGMMDEAGVVYSYVGYGHVAGLFCPAYKNGGQCGKCRACWSRRVKEVCYPMKVGKYYFPKATVKRLGWPLGPPNEKYVAKIAAAKALATK